MLHIASPLISSITCNSLIATQEFEGNPCNIGTRNWRQPDQWPMSSIMQIKLKIRMNTLAMLRNCKQERKKTCPGHEINTRID